VIGLDTNVVVRYLTRDDEGQFRAAEAVMRAAARTGEPVYIGLPVLLETVWVLQRAYAVDRSAVASTLQALLESPDIVLENEPLVEAALDAFQTGSADFADYVIGIGNATAGCRHTLTFDERAAQAPTFEAVPRA
jgi:predicted nucleic-acid-binding protein